MGERGKEKGELGIRGGDEEGTLKGRLGGEGVEGGRDRDPP